MIEANLIALAWIKEYIHTITTEINGSKFALGSRFMRRENLSKTNTSEIQSMMHHEKFQSLNRGFTSFFLYS